jgi:hypothetical protein
MAIFIKVNDKQNFLPLLVGLNSWASECGIILILKLKKRVLSHPLCQYIYIYKKKHKAQEK